MLIRLFMMTLLLLAGCNPFVPPKSDPPQLPESYQQTTQQGIQLPDRWWELFGDDQLNQLQIEMLASNLDLRQTLYRLEQLEALRKTSAASLWPSLSLNASASRDRTPAVTGSSIANSSRISLAAGYELDLWNRLHDKEQAAELRAQASGKEAQTLLLSLTAQLTEAYFQAVEKRAQIELVRRQIKRNQQLLDTATDRYRGGLASADEIYSAQNSLITQQARLPQLQTALTQSEQAITLLLGRFSGKKISDQSKLPEISALTDMGLPATLLTNRPDIAAAFLQLQAADKELAAALASRLPTVNLTASLGRSSTQLASGDLEGAFWSLAASLAQPLFDGGRRQAEVDRQQALRNEQAANMQQSLLKAIQEVQTALTADQNNALRSQQLEQLRHVSGKTLQLERDNYRSGLTSSSALLAAELQHLSVISQQLSNQREWLSSRISLARALGGQWMSAELTKQQQALTAAEDK